MITSEEIGRSLENINNNSWLLPVDWKTEYRMIKQDIIDCLMWDVGWERITTDTDKIKELKEWKESQPNWEQIIKNNDVAMFPNCLSKVKSMFLVNIDKEYCESVSRLSYEASIDDNGIGEKYHQILEEFKAEYGVFRFRAIVGDNMFMMLRRHLQISEEDFQNVYGLGLHDDICACDDLLINMFVEGRLTGEVRGYRIDREYYQ